MIRFLLSAIALILASGEAAATLNSANPYRAVDDWAKLPPGRPMGAVGDLKMDPDGRHLWAIIRCTASERSRFGDECRDSTVDPVVKFDLDGDVVQSFGGRLQKDVRVRP